MILQNLPNLVDLVAGECDRSIVSDAAHDSLLRDNSPNLEAVRQQCVS